MPVPESRTPPGTGAIAPCTTGGLGAEEPLGDRDEERESHEHTSKHDRRHKRVPEGGAAPKGPCYSAERDSR